MSTISQAGRRAVSRTMPPPIQVQRQIHLVRGRKIMVDADLAALYGVTTGNLNLAVRRNPTRFPDDFMFQLTREEADSLLLQIARANGTRGGRRSLPFVFTELGVAMLSSVLNSERAVQMNIVAMRAFVQLRQVVAHNKHIAARMEKLEEDFKENRGRVASVIEVLVEDIDRIEQEVKQMKALPPPRKRKIGF
jgi:hypothetical protein